MQDGLCFVAMRKGYRGKKRRPLPTLVLKPKDSHFIAVNYSYFTCSPGSAESTFYIVEYSLEASPWLVHPADKPGSLEQLC